jgi:superfamily II DNA/RNA helicase
MFHYSFFNFQDFQRISEIQQCVIPVVMSGRDVAAQAHPRTGKTTALAIAVLQQIDTSICETQALVLCPTQQSAIDVQSAIFSLGKNMGVECYVCAGGAPIGEDLLQLATNHSQHVVIGTPDSILNQKLIHESILKLRASRVKILALDDADILINKGFKDEILDIRRFVSALRTRIIVLSTTLPHALLETTTELITDANAVRITVERDAYTPVSEGIKHFFLDVAIPLNLRLGTIPRLLDLLKVSQAVVFCNTPSQASISLYNSHKLGLMTFRLIVLRDPWTRIVVYA